MSFCPGTPILNQCKRLHDDACDQRSRRSPNVNEKPDKNVYFWLTGVISAALVVDWYDSSIVERTVVPNDLDQVDSGSVRHGRGTCAPPEESDGDYPNDTDEDDSDDGDDGDGNGGKRSD
ncbi:unnamed protein product [Schistocephalus solidus]|uniref:Uncharacterized protein n=1 Tax=Schistocephalus solidus TaxID=70667 RepID=A0A183SB08_SCHSO|nr:unnamed protein product [Schistocephalus solidus]